MLKKSLNRENFARNQNIYVTHMRVSQRERERGQRTRQSKPIKLPRMKKKKIKRLELVTNEWVRLVNVYV